MHEYCCGENFANKEIDLPTIFDTYMAAAPYVPAIPPNGVCI